MVRRSLLATMISVAALVSPSANAGPSRPVPVGERFCPNTHSLASRHYAHGSTRRLDTKRLEGKLLRNARAIARRHDCEVRIVKRDGDWLVVTTDYQLDRINVAVRGDRVKRSFGVY